MKLAKITTFFYLICISGIYADRLVKTALVRIGSMNGVDFYCTHEKYSYKMAEKLSKGVKGKLAEPRTEPQNNMIRNFLMAEFAKPTEGAWLGGTRNGNKNSSAGAYYWSSDMKRPGSGGLIQDWAPNKPDNVNNTEKYIGMAAPDYHWDDFNGDELKHVIIEIPHRQNKTSGNATQGVLRVTHLAIGQTDNKLFFISNSKHTFQMAVDICAGYEARLAELRTREQNDAIKDFLLEEDYKNKGDVWLGGYSNSSNITDPDGYYWLSDKITPGSNGTITDWDYSQPSDEVANARCMGMSSVTFSWRNYPENNTLFVACEKVHTTGEAELLDGERENKYEEVGNVEKKGGVKNIHIRPIPIGRVGDNDYIISSYKIRFHSAVEFCKMIHAKLAEPKSKTDLNYIKDYLKTDNYTERGNVWIGVRRRDEEASDSKAFYWLSDRSRVGSNGTVEDWSPYQPDNNNNDQMYVGLDAPNFTWNDFPGFSKLFALCEKKADSNTMPIVQHASSNKKEATKVTVPPMLEDEYISDSIHEENI